MLSPPPNWPPKRWQPEVGSQSVVFRIPFLGRVIQWLYEQRAFTEYRYSVLFPIEQELRRSVIERPPADLTLLSCCEREILELLAIAFKESRATSSIPPIYPDDQLELLLWGIDDTTLLQFKLMFQQKFHVYVEQDLMWKVVTAKEATVSDLLEFCQAFIKSRSRDEE